MNIVIIGRTEMLYHSAERLQRAGHQIRAIVTAPAADEYSKKEGDFRRLAAQIGADFFCGPLSDPSVEVACRGAEVGVSVNWPHIIAEEQIRLFPHGILNAHLGDLPRYRGNACPNWAILQGEREIWLTIHAMIGGEMDCGRVLHKRSLLLSDTTSIAEVYRWANEAIPAGFVAALERLGQKGGWGVSKASADAPDAFRCYPRLPRDGYIDWATMTAREVARLVRASGPPFSGAYCYQESARGIHKLVVLECEEVAGNLADLAVAGQIMANDEVGGGSLVACSGGIVRLKLCRYDDEEMPFQPGKRWRSIRQRLGVRAEDWLWTLQQQLAGSGGEVPTPKREELSSPEVTPPQSPTR